MKISFYFKDIDKNCEDQIKSFFAEEKSERVTNLLRHGNLDLADLKVSVEYFSHHNDFFVELILNIARHKVLAEKRSFDLTEALNVALDRLVFQLRKIEEIRHYK